MSSNSNSVRGLPRYPVYALGRLTKALHAEIDVPLRDHWVLTFIAENADLTQKKVGEALGIDRSEVVRLIDALERADLVERTRDGKDRRKYRLRITEAGRKQCKRTDKLIADATARVLDRLDTEEQATLHRLALTALGEPPDPPA
ncbi:MarR family transcriptional regulator [Nocardia asteroides NBRC 15531]|uniref:MarR family transcriptional regulator n=1 Tax=Nocardia asteroides NBRC 15531 TaxID=1110697 RepID=U5EBJ2_NOCAS|nr:MarR family transcriptional regulator [Nocardia asteroides]TLF62189.1 MarR family transcriptional regulator [Nocardia asteroides NBRC 15531]UGT48215.1 MarR family transcriptional regulator [Nocardia asteroides]SFN72584.1 DNA-binding transcriptional regulator, MarR family [Nocardia asteroides]VEG32732.1 Staphylococcal accessory regulator Z [Nocardia asteroides]GAD84700.1 putative MarR family transcriptional regulator [Nocardia asteroides NBRC 15531]